MKHGARVNHVCCQDIGAERIRLEAGVDGCQRIGGVVAVDEAGVVASSDVECRGRSGRGGDPPVFESSELAYPPGSLRLGSFGVVDEKAELSAHRFELLARPLQVAGGVAHVCRQIGDLEYIWSYAYLVLGKFVFDDRQAAEVSPLHVGVSAAEDLRALEGEVHDREVESAAVVRSEVSFGNSGAFGREDGLAHNGCSFSQKAVVVGKYAWLLVGPVTVDE